MGRKMFPPIGFAPNNDHDRGRGPLGTHDGIIPIRFAEECQLTMMDLSIFKAANHASR
jgi:hypothetical protein